MEDPGLSQRKKTTLKLKKYILNIIELHVTCETRFKAVYFSLAILKKKDSDILESRVLKI